MSFLLGKRERQYMLFVGLMSLLIIAYTFFCNAADRHRLGAVLLSHEEILVSSLLEQGVSQETIAKAYQTPVVTTYGTELVQKLGVTESNILSRQAESTGSDSLFVDTGVQLLKLRGFFFSSIGMLLAVVLVTGSCVYLRRKESDYEAAAEIVRQFTEGDFTNHLAEHQEGALCRLFSAVDELALSLKNKEEAEHQTKEFLKDTISDISHQLKTPLAALHMYQEIIEGEPENPKTVKQFAGKSEMALGRMDRLIQLLLKVMRLDAGSIIFVKEAHRVEDVLYEAVEELRVRAETEHKQLILEGSGECMFCCDRLWTEEAISNLVKNALDYTKQDEMVNIKWEETPAMLRIYVEDNGAGIAQEDIHHIFKRFYRGTGAGDQPGIGLGLSLAKAIIEGQEGSLTVQSAEGQGTVFCISFKKNLSY